ncbi:MAG: hypothetical protein AABX89_07625 [Candidatus Thermoplasmatota archaeon]
MEGKQDSKRKMGLVLMVACPACAGGFFLAVGAVFGATALALKGLAAVAVLTLVAGLWARNAWNRRNEDAACPTPAAKPNQSPGSDVREVR